MEVSFFLLCDQSVKRRDSDRSKNGVKCKESEWQYYLLLNVQN